MRLSREGLRTNMPFTSCSLALSVNGGVYVATQSPRLHCEGLAFCGFALSEFCKPVTQRHVQCSFEFCFDLL